MILTEIERNSPLWLKIRAECESRLAHLRVSNDKDMSESDTAKHRGRIAEIKRVIDLGKEEAKIEVE